MRCFLSVVIAILFGLSPNFAWSQEGGEMLSSTTSSTSPGESGGEVSTNAASTSDAIDATFMCTDDSVASSSEWTSMQLAASATNIVVVVLLVVLAAALLVALGIGIWMSVRAPAGDETAFRRFLRHNRNALHQELVVGHGPVLRDMGAMFAVDEAYPAFADTLRGDQAELRRWLTAEAIEQEGVEAIRQRIVADLLRRPEVFEAWLRDGVLELKFTL